MVSLSLNSRVPSNIIWLKTSETKNAKRLVRPKMEKHEGSKWGVKNKTEIYTD
jgi:hypothetical protein